MIQIIEKQKQELMVGLADLFIQKENIEEQIKIQRVAIRQCMDLINQAKAAEEKTDVQT
jgi:hypothetical protein